jgi:hypothetical protein
MKSFLRKLGCLMFSAFFGLLYQGARASTITYLQGRSDIFQHTVDLYTDADAAGNHFAARGEIDSLQADRVGAMDEISPSVSCYAGITCITATFDPKSVAWGGWYFLNGILGPNDREPLLNWGTVPNAGFDLSGATALQFWAKGSVGGEVLHFFAFGVGNTVPPYMPYPDSSRKVELPGGAVRLTTTWTKYTVPIDAVDLHYALGGFAWQAFAAEQASSAPVVFFLDNIQYLKERPNDLRLLVS